MLYNHNFLKDSTKSTKLNPSSVKFNSVAQLCLTLCNPMDCSMSGFPVLHNLTEFASHPLSSPSPPAFYLSQHQGLFQWVSSLYQVAKVLELQLWHQYLQSTFRVDFLKDWLLWSPCSPMENFLQHHSLKTSVLQHSAFFMIQLSPPYMTPGKTIVWLYGPLWAKWYLYFLKCCLGLS